MKVADGERGEQREGGSDGIESGRRKAALEAPTLGVGQEPGVRSPWLEGGPCYHQHGQTDTGGSYPSARVPAIMIG